MAIYIATHKNAAMPVCDWMQPIGLGGYRDERVSLSDCDGESIGHLNRNYVELTGLYWLLKHCRDEYVGFCHYRRYFTFFPYQAPDTHYPPFIMAPTNEDNLRYLSSDEQKAKMLSLLDTYDFIVPRPIMYAETMAQAFINAHGEPLWESFLDACRTEFGYDTSYFEHETRFYCCNMFVTHYEKFRDYLQSLFRVIDAVYSDFGDLEDMPDVRYQPHRYPAYIAERYLGFYLFKTTQTAFETPMIWLE